MKTDAEGFLYPEVDQGACIKCGACENVCPILAARKERFPLRTFGAVCTDDTIRMKSSSGGVFSSFATSVIQSGGVVFGARFDKRWQVIIDSANTIEQLTLLRGSKYVQARIDDAYSKAEQLLKAGKKILFSGTPCQTAGLLCFLHRDYDNLVTIDVACHGVPSPKVWEAYLTDATRLANKQRSCTLQSYYYHHPYMRAFLQDLILRPSCHHCRMKNGSSGTDLTIADFWGVQTVCPQLFDNKGTSLILAYTQKGLDLLDGLHLKRQEVDYNSAVSHNPALERSFAPHPRRNHFFACLEGSDSIISLIEKELRPPLVQRIKRLVKSALGKQKNDSHLLAFKQTADSNAIPASGLTYDHICSIDFRKKLSGWTNYSVEINWNPLSH